MPKCVKIGNFDSIFTRNLSKTFNLEKGDTSMADVVDYKIYGDDMQIVEVELDPGEAVRAEAGAMLYMDEGIEMQTSTGGGLFRGFKRMVTGAGFFIATFLYKIRLRRFPLCHASHHASLRLPRFARNDFGSPQ
jgi:hypothetical protein